MKKLTVIGFILGLVGFLIEGASGYIEDKKMEELIDTKIDERLAENN